MKLVFLVDSVQFFRDLFRSPLLTHLLKQEGTELILASIFNPDVLRSEISHPRLKVVALRQRKASLINRWLHSMARDVYTIEHPVGSFAQRRWTVAETNSSETSLRWRLLLARVWRVIGLNSQRLIRIGERFGSDPGFGKLLDDDRPDAVIYSYMIPAGFECLKEARRRQIPLILMVASWDNPTSKGPLTVVPDYSIVWSEQMRDEMKEYHGLPPDRMEIAGVLYFENYFHPERLLGRGESCRDLGIPEDRKIIHFATGDSAIMNCNQEFIRILHRILESGQLSMPSHLLVRVSPKDKFELYREFEGLPNLTVQYPSGRGEVYGGHKWIPDPGEELERASTIRNSDVILSVSSSMVLDASCFDVPTINLAYDAGMPAAKWESVDRFYLYTHALPVLEEEATLVVKNDDELVAALKVALEKPETKREERARLLRRLVQFTDGKTHERLAEAFARLIARNRRST